MKRRLVGFVAVMLCIAPSVGFAASVAASGGGSAPVPPAAGGIKFQVDANGRTKRYTQHVTLAQASASLSGKRNPPGPAAAPMEEITISKASITQLPKLTRSLGASLSYRPQALAGSTPPSCNTFNIKESWNSLLWAKLTQTWCYDGKFVVYWPASYCWGGDKYPTYSYNGCSTSQLYGLYWNQGRVTWDADMCPYWVPFWGTCLSHYRVHANFYFAPNGAAWRL